MEKWLDEINSEENQSLPIHSINLIEVVQNILKNPEQKRHVKKLYDLKDAAKMLSFLQTNDIFDMAKLHKTVVEIHARYNDVSTKLNKVERRLKVLDEHIKQAGLYKEHKALYKMYQEVHPKHKSEFYEDNRAGITLYESAKRYLDGVMDGNKTLPTKEWKAEREKLTAEKPLLYQAYYKMKDEVKEVETIRRNIEDITREDKKISKDRKKSGLEI